MKNRKLLLLAFGVLIFYAAIRTLTASLTASQVMRMVPPKAMGIGAELQATVTRLEKEIGARNSFEPDVKNDPLKLSRIISGSHGRANVRAEMEESRGQFRLSCTIISSNKSTAIIKHAGKSFVVGVGDAVDGRTVISIDKKKVVLRFNGVDLELVNRPAPLGEIRFETKTQLDKIDL